ncbi:MAG: penicillin-binding protein activator [Casimicrobiaceae bacterium]
MAILFAAAALSCASVRPATRVRVISPLEAVVPEQGEPNPPGPYDGALAETVPAAAFPATPGAEALRPAPEEPPDAASVQPGGDRIPAPPTSNLIALILPLDEPAFQRAASAVRDGFFDAAAAAGKSGDCIVIRHGRDGVVGAFQMARGKGVRVAVGPLVRDDLKTLALANADLPWTLALNQLDDGTKLPPAIYAFPLTVESDGRTLARHALEAGAHSIDVIEGDSPLMKRLASSFATEWTARGGEAPAALRFDPAPEALTALRRTVTRNVPDAVLLAINGDHAALMKPFIGGIDAYASGLVFERPSAAVAHDLDGVRVVEIPWLLTRDAPEFASFKRRDFDSDSLARLYALGLDAYRVAASFQNGPPDRFELDGATGHIELAPGHEFQRAGRLGVYRGGVLVPLDAAP